MDATKLVQSNRDKLSPPGNFACYDTLAATRKFLGQHATVNLLPTDSYQNDGMPIHEYIISNVPCELISIKRQNECRDMIRIAGTLGISASRQLQLEPFTAKECAHLLVTGIITTEDTEYVSKLTAEFLQEPERVTAGQRTPVTRDTAPGRPSFQLQAQHNAAQRAAQAAITAARLRYPTLHGICPYCECRYS
jgi:hypothetical protein